MLQNAQFVNATQGDDDFDTRSLEERIGITGAIKSKYLKKCLVKGYDSLQWNVLSMRPIMKEKLQEKVIALRRAIQRT